MIKYTIVIPTYNRMNLLQRSIDAIECINYDKKQIELIIVDDGSTDGTAEFLESYKPISLLNYKYLIKPNNGKYSAVHLAVIEAVGEYFIVTDSDDYLDEDILNKVDKALNKFRDLNSNSIAGVIGLNYNISSKKVEGENFNSTFFISDPVDMRFKHKKKGDEIKIIKTELFKEFNFPKAIKGVKFIPESYVYYGLSSKYKFIYTNEVLQYIDYQHDGLTRKIKKYRLENSYGCYLAYERYINLVKLKKTRVGYIRNYINYIRFAIHSKKRVYFLKPYTILIYPIGFCLYLYDLKNK